MHSTAAGAAKVIVERDKKTVRIKRCIVGILIDCDGFVGNRLLENDLQLDLLQVMRRTVLLWDEDHIYFDIDANLRHSETPYYLYIAVYIISVSSGKIIEVRVGKA